MGTLSVVSGLLNAFLPETYGKGMPENLNDLDSLLHGRLDLRVDETTGDIYDEEDSQEEALLVQGA